MRPTPWHAAEPYRIGFGDFGSSYADSFGAFRIPYKGISLLCIVGDGDFEAAQLSPIYAWEHVSVSLKNRTPNWYEMDFIKDIFWAEDETVIQFHVPKKDHINIHPSVLHLWKPLRFEFPLPPPGAV